MFDASAFMGEGQSMKDLAELFLTPSSILVGALGVASTEGLKAGLSALGILTTVLWLLSYSEVVPVRTVLCPGSALGCLPVLFFFAWSVSAWIHIKKFCAERKAKSASSA